MGAYILSGGNETSPKARRWKLYVHLISFVVSICFCYDCIYSYYTNTSLTILNKTWLSWCSSAFWCVVRTGTLLERSPPFNDLPFLSPFCVYLWLISNRPILKSCSVSCISVIFLWLESDPFIAQNFVQNVRAIQMSCSVLVHLSPYFYCSCQADYCHALSRSSARFFMAWISPVSRSEFSYGMKPIFNIQWRTEKGTQKNSEV